MLWILHLNNLNLTGCFLDKKIVSRQEKGVKKRRSGRIIFSLFSTV